MQSADEPAPRYDLLRKARETYNIPFRVVFGDETFTIATTAWDARRRVSGWVCGYVATTCGSGKTPELFIQGTQPYWRVPVVFTRIGQGIVGEIGFVMVDAQNGDLIDATESHADELRNNAIALAKRVPAPPFKIRSVPPGYAAHT